MAATVASYLSWHYSPRNTPSFRLSLSDQVVDCGPLRARSLKLVRITIEGISNDTTNHAESAPHVRVGPLPPLPPPPLSGSVLLNLPEWVGSDFAISLFSLNDLDCPADRLARRSGVRWYCMPGLRTDRPRLLALLSGRQPCGMTIEVVNSPIHNVQQE